MTFEYAGQAYKSGMSDASVQSLIRFGLGAGPNDGVIGDPRGALKAQLRGPDPALGSPGFAGLPSGLDGVDALRDDILARKAVQTAGKPLPGNFRSKSREMYIADAKAQLDWAASTNAGFRERLVWFWTNHFTVSIYQGQTAALVGPMVREAIRPHVNGNFTDMVLAVERHPAMLRYLANDQSIGPDSAIGRRAERGLNENLGRECMELHTVGLAAGYSQTDVTNMANLLTGWSVAGRDKGGDATGFKYRPYAHQPGTQVVLGQSFWGGEQAGADALAYLSRYPTTYQLLAGKLVTHFVADQPPPDAVAQIADVLTATGGRPGGSRGGNCGFTASLGADAKTKNAAGVHGLGAARRPAAGGPAGGCVSGGAGRARPTDLGSTPAEWLAGSGGGLGWVGCGNVEG